MQSASTAPVLPLQDILKEYYWLSIITKDKNKSIPIIDDCSYDFVFFKEKNAQLCYGRDNICLDCNAEVFTVHDLTPPYTIIFDNELTFFTIKPQPWMNGYFFPELKEKGVIDITQSSPFSPYFRKQIFGASSPEEKFALVNNHFQKLHIKLTTRQKLVKELCEFIQIKKGLVSINDISDHFKKSRQYLNKVFKQEVRYSIKKYVTAVRILSLVHYKVAHPNTSLTQITYEYLYFDQAHFIKDFKNICGIKPKLFFENLPEFLMRHK